MYQQPPQTQDAQLWTYFSAIDTDRSGAINEQELGRALINGDWRPFHATTIHLLMRLFDRNRSGTLTFDEFRGLWRYIEDWKRCFIQFDRDRSGEVDAGELHTALQQFGLPVSPQMVQRLIMDCHDTPGKRGDVNAGLTGPGHHGVSFDHFIRICVTVRTVTDAFQRFDTDRDGWVQLNYDQFMDLILMTR